MSPRSPRIRIPVLACVLALAAAGGPRAVVFVDAGSVCAPCDGTALAPFPTIQQGIDAAGGGETVQVAAGTYVENVLVAGKEVQLLAVDGPAQTVIDGGAAGSTLTLNDAGGSSVTGFRITGGRAPFGGGIDVVGGGLPGEPTISRNVITGNQAIEVVTGTDGDGGGICLYDAPGATVVGNLIRANTGVKLGGGIALVASDDATVAFNTIAFNSLTGVASGFGPGIGVSFGSGLTIANNVIGGNTSASSSTGGLDVYFAGAAIDGNLFHLNQPANFVSTEGPLPPGNTEADPKVLDAGGGDLHLSLASPAVDGAAPAAAADPLDLDGNPRPLDADRDGSAVADVGCYEHLGLVDQLSVTAAGVVSWTAAEVAPDAYHVYRSSRAGLLGGSVGDCQDPRDPDLTDLTFTESEAPAAGEMFTFLVGFARNGAVASLGLDSAGAERFPPLPCP